MSDLDQAVQAEIDAWTPATSPPFDALTGRKRARDRRRMATGGAALSAVALSAAVLGPSLLGGGPDRLPTLTEPPPPAGAQTADKAGVSRAAVRPAPANGSYEEALANGVLRADSATGCLWLEQSDGGINTQLLLQGEHYSVDFGASPAAVLAGDTVVARIGDRVEVVGGLNDRDAGVEGCPVPPPVYLGVLTDQLPALLETDADIAAFVEECLYGMPAAETPKLVGRTEAEVFPANARSAVRVLGRDGVCNMGSAVPNYPNVVLVDGIVVWAGVLMPDAPTATETSTNPASGPEVLLHHCGVRPVTFDGREWEVTKVPFDATNAPSTFSGEGTYTMSEATLVFADRAGARLVFTPDDGKPNGPPCA